MRILTIIFILCCQLVYSQRLDLEYGKVSMDEIKMESYTKDKSAKAVVLYDKGLSTFYDTKRGYDIRFNRHKRIKVFDKSSLESAVVSIPYYVDGYGQTEEVKSIEAITYNYVDGKLIEKKLDPSTIYTERINQQWYHKKFVFPDVQDGSILEYRYVLETPFHLNLPDWNFQDKIPTVYSEYQLRMIPFYEYVFLVQGINKFDYQNSIIDKQKRTWGKVVHSHGRNVGSGVEFQDYVHTYVLKDVPAFTDESYITSINDYIINMDFQLAKVHSPTGGSSDIISTWAELNKALLKHEKFGKYLKKSSKIAKKVLSKELILDKVSVLDNIKLIQDYVKENFEWNGYKSKYASQSAKELFKTKRGNSADINLFLIALLSEAGIDVKPLILSTRDHGKIANDYPFDHFTNYVVAFVETDSNILLDGTEELLPFKMLPVRCYNEKGLVVEKSEKSRWIDISNARMSIDKNTIKLVLDTVELNLLAEVTIQKTDYESYETRTEFKDDLTQIQNYYSDKIGSILELNSYDYDQIEDPYTLSLKSEYRPDQVATALVIKPFLDLPMSENNLTQKTRRYPIDFIRPWEQIFESSFTIPKGYILPELPEGYSINNQLAEIELTYKLDDRTLIAKGKYKFKKSIYLASKYNLIKSYMNQIIEEFNRPVVIEPDI